LGRPVALGSVEPKRAGGVRHVARLAAGQKQPDIVLRQKDGAKLGENLGLVVLDPQELRRSETRHGEVAGDDLAPGAELGRLGTRPAVVPEDAGPEPAI